MTNQRPSFLDAYLVATDSMGSEVVGVVRKSRNVWRIMRFGVSDEKQPRDVFATREEAGQALLALSHG